MTEVLGGIVVAGASCPRTVSWFVTFDLRAEIVQPLSTETLPMSKMCN